MDKKAVALTTAAASNNKMKDKLCVGKVEKQKESEPQWQSRATRQLQAHLLGRHILGV